MPLVGTYDFGAIRRVASDPLKQKPCSKTKHCTGTMTESEVSFSGHGGWTALSLRLGMRQVFEA